MKKPWRKFEKWVCDEFRKAGFDKARVSCQSRGGLGQPDVDAHPFHLECKHYEKAKLDIKATLQRARREKTRCDKYAAVVWSDNEGDITVTMDFRDFMNPIQEYITKI